jgi:hypothetical protein
MEVLNYYLIENPLKDGKIIVTDKDRLKEIQEKISSEGAEKILHIPDRKWVYSKEIYEKVEKFEDWLKNMYRNEARELKGWCAVYIGAGIAFSYLFFKPLFNFAYSPVRYLFESRYEASIEEVPPEVVNRTVDIGAQWFARVAGTTMGNLPFIVSIAYGIKKLKEAKKLDELVKSIDKSKNITPKVNENLAEFEEKSKEIVNSIRNYTKILESGNRREKFNVCKKIEGEIQRLYNLSRTYNLDEVASYYQELSEKFLELEKRLKKPRFWRSEEKFIKELVEENEI